MIHLLTPTFLIPMIFLFIWIRNGRKNNRKSWNLFLLMFIWGSIIAFGFSIILEGFSFYLISNYLVLILVFVPIIEEILKAIGLRIVKNQISDLEDGIIYGVFSGFGFVVTENLFYGIVFWNEGAITLLSLFFMRTIGRTLLHVSASGIAGYGYSRKIVRNKKLRVLLPFICFSIGIHSLYNLLAISELIVVQIIGVSISVLFTLLLIYFIIKKFRVFDKRLEKKESPLLKIH